MVPVAIPSSLEMDTTKELNRLCELYLSRIMAYRESATLEETNADQIGYLKVLIDCFSSDIANLGYPTISTGTSTIATTR
jgi:hypothetical protein